MPTLCLARQMHLEVRAPQGQISLRTFACTRGGPYVVANSSSFGNIEALAPRSHFLPGVERKAVVRPGLGSSCCSHLQRRSSDGLCGCCLWAGVDAPVRSSRRSRRTSRSSPRMVPSFALAPSLKLRFAPATVNRWEKFPTLPLTSNRGTSPSSWSLSTRRRAHAAALSHCLAEFFATSTAENRFCAVPLGDVQGSPKLPDVSHAPITPRG